MNHLDPGVMHGPWTRAELLRLVAAVQAAAAAKAAPPRLASPTPASPMALALLPSAPSTSAAAAGASESERSGDEGSGGGPGGGPRKNRRGGAGRGRLPWSDIARQFPGRTDAMVKDAWKALQRCGALAARACARPPACTRACTFGGAHRRPCRPS